MRRKACYFLQLVLILFQLVLLLLAFCAYLNEKAFSAAMEKTVPEASQALVLRPSVLPGVETSSIEEIIYDSELAAYISVEDSCTIADYADFRGKNYRCGVFQLRSPEYETILGSGVKMLTCDIIYWEIVVLLNEAVVDVLRIEKGECGSAVPACEDLVTEIDVDFDGANDLLLCLGHFGAQGAVAYKCWLTRDNALAYCPSFEEISNPALDPERKEVLSQWRNMAVSHGYGIYRFLEDAFVMTERLTEQPVNMDSEEIVWSWTDEILVDGEWQLREYFTRNDYDDETLYAEKIYGDTAYWDISSDRWRSLYNGGKISDLRIPESNQAAVFRRFYRENEVHDQPGVGTGLYLTREIITRRF